MVDIRTTFQALLAGRYSIERELGRGGMATVFLARDLKHDRLVALKVMRPELAAAMGAERFRREIMTAARLQHPHVLTVYDSGETAGRFWFTMPYVEGESLRDRLERERRLPVADAVRLARDLALALDYAHRHGVVHRDVKPENVLLNEDGQALLADFGLARASGPASDPTGSRGAPAALTGTGFFVGTPAYMSPEQATGEHPVDARTDVYALGCVLYEMLVGEAPFAGPTLEAIFTRRLTTDAPLVRELRPEVPPAVEGAVARALARAPGDRFATAAELAQALAPAPAPDAGWREDRAPRAHPAPAREAPRAPLRLALLIGTSAAAAGLAALVWQRTHAGALGAGAAPVAVGAATAPAPTRLAVLPFENLGRPEDAYIADGLTDEIRGKLAAVPGMQVIARASSNEYRRSAKPPQAIAAELGVRYLLTGTVRSEPGQVGRAARLRISPELVEVAAGRAPVSRWSQGFDAEVADVFAMQADIAGRVAGAMDVALAGGARARLAEAPTRNAAAYDAYLRGEAAGGALSAADPNALRRALGYYTEAVALDSGFAEAWAQRARAASLLYANGVPTAELAREARDAAERALALAPGRPAGYLARGNYYAIVEADYERALAAYEAGRRLAPADADLLAGVATAGQWLARSTDAVRDFQAAAALDPRSPATARRLAVALLWARRYPEARAAADRALALTPTNAVMIENRAMVELAEGDLARARRVLAAAPPELDPSTLVAVMGNFWDLAWVLDDAQQRRLLALGPAAFDDDRGSWGWVLSQTYALRGDSGRARAYADTARAAFEAQLRATPDAAQTLVLYGLTLATLGRPADAVREAERGVALRPPSRNAYQGAYLQHQLARVYLLAGQPERAIDALEPLLKMPYYLSPGWLRIDPTFAPLRGNPRFERLAAGR